MTVIIDRRNITSTRHLSNVDKFIKYNKSELKRAIKELITKDKSFSEIEKTNQIKIFVDNTIRKINLVEKTKSHVIPGNYKWRKGDRIYLPKFLGQGCSSSGSDGEDSNDGVNVEIYDILEELSIIELPNFIMKYDKSLKREKLVHGGFINSGNPSQLSIIRSYKNSIARSLAIKFSIEEKIKKLTDKDEIEKLNNIKDKIPFIHDFDLRYRVKKKEYEYISNAVVYFLMDVSGSMDEERRAIAKTLFFVLYLLLKKNYPELKVEFVIHTTNHYHVSEKDFFNSQISGGTAFYPALDFINKHIDQNYDPNNWNVYVFNVSDFDNYSSDTDASLSILRQSMLPKLNYFGSFCISTGNYFDSSNAEVQFNQFRSILSYNYNAVQVKSKAHIIPSIYECFRYRKDEAKTG